MEGKKKLAVVVCQPCPMRGKRSSLKVGAIHFSFIDFFPHQLGRGFLSPFRSRKHCWEGRIAVEASCKPHTLSVAS